MLRGAVLRPHLSYMNLNLDFRSILLSYLKSCWVLLCDWNNCWTRAKLSVTARARAALPSRSSYLYPGGPSRQCGVNCKRPLIYERAGASAAKVAGVCVVVLRIVQFSNDCLTDDAVFVQCRRCFRAIIQCSASQQPHTRLQTTVSVMALSISVRIVSEKARSTLQFSFCRTKRPQKRGRQARASEWSF
jgi:hypothetical protein